MLQPRSVRDFSRKVLSWAPWFVRNPNYPIIFSSVASSSVGWHWGQSTQAWVQSRSTGGEEILSCQIHAGTCCSTTEQIAGTNRCEPKTEILTLKKKSHAENQTGLSNSTASHSLNDFCQFCAPRKMLKPQSVHARACTEKRLASLKCPRQAPPPAPTIID